MKGKKPRLEPSSVDISRLRYLKATVLRCSLRYYYPGVDPGEPPQDYEFDALEHELEILHLKLGYRRIQSTDRGAAGFKDWLEKHPEKSLSPLVINIDPAYANGWCG